MTNETGVKNKLSADEGRELTLRGLSGEPRQVLADHYGVSLRTVEKRIADAKAMTEADADEISKELEFRRRVLVMLENE